ncbi:MAG: hypothetical protein DMG23_14445 [Acidobacteria bacterium]|nr:MAG: hypothetical protein DMG23_14445 [Acidobacteriota bacterium]
MSDDDPRQRASQLFLEAYRQQMNGELEKAVELYQKSIEIFPTAEAHTFLGWTYSFTGNYDRAIAECRRAIEVLQPRTHLGTETRHPAGPPRLPKSP